MSFGSKLFTSNRCAHQTVITISPTWLQHPASHSTLPRSRICSTKHTAALKGVAKADLLTGPALEPIKVSQIGREFRHCLDEQFQSKDDKHAALDSQVSYPPTRWPLTLHLTSKCLPLTHSASHLEVLVTHSLCISPRSACHSLTLHLTSKRLSSTHSAPHLEALATHPLCTTGA